MKWTDGVKELGRRVREWLSALEDALSPLARSLCRCLYATESDSAEQRGSRPVEGRMLLTGRDATGRRHTLALGLILGLHLLALPLFVIDVRLPFVLGLAVAGVVVALERPLWGVALLIAGRLTSTGANAWVRIGRVNVDLFEPALLLCVGALVVHASLRQRTDVLGRAPWRAPVLLFLGYQVLALAWTHDLGESVKAILATGVLLATTGVILTFVNSWSRLRGMLWLWLATSCFVAVASVLGLMAPTDTEVGFEMASGSREGGFGQHPNWFAMNLMFIIPVAFALAAIEKKPVLRWLAFLGGVVVFLAQMRSGSRAGTWTLLAAGGLAAIAHPAFRKQALVLGGVASAVVGVVLLSDAGATARAFERIFLAGTLALGQSVRVANWEVCWQLFVDTWGRGIGGGGYEALLAVYDSWLYDSQYTYPHGIFWGLMANYGVVGLFCFGWFLWRVVGMARQLLAWTDGRREQVLVWGMLASLLAYFVWSFVEFSFEEKPFWEFLGLFTALWLVERRRALSEGDP